MQEALPKLIKVHWECWSDCNLACQFCYRSRSAPICTAQAISMLEKLFDFGVRQIVFAGGDPLIRPDIGELAVHAAHMGFKVEIQTNCQFVPKDIDNWIEYVSLFGVSIDGASAATHDMMREKKGNFKKVFEFIERIERMAVPFVVRTLVSKRNSSDIAGIGALVKNAKGLKKWSLLEFSSVGDGARNNCNFAIPEEEFLSVANSVIDVYRRSIPIDVYNGKKKEGVYFLIRSDGQVYTTSGELCDGYYKTVGSVLETDMDQLYSRLQFDSVRHKERYDGLM